jgi:GntR family transcriptional repressor for pyruvate dehydrogenase complex
VTDRSSPEGAESPARGDKRAERLARHVMDDVAAERLGPGDRLDGEARMMSRYGVGRPTVREALRLLESQGLVAIKPGRGGGPVLLSRDGGRHLAQVSMLRLQYLGATYDELLVVRSTVEALTARLAAERGEDADTTALRAAVEEMAQVDLDDDAEYRHLLGRVPAALGAICGNRVVALLAGAIREIHETGISPALIPPRAREESRTLLAALGRSVWRGHPQRAEALARRSIDHQIAAVRAGHPHVLDEVIAVD